MPIMAAKKKKEYTAAPEGLWPAVCCDVVDLGLQKSQWGEQYKVQIRWILDPADPELVDPKSGKSFMVVKRYTNSLHEKSRLRPMLEGWRGKKFSAEEEDGFDLEKLIGVCCQVQIVHNAVDEGDVYADVQAVVPFPKNQTKIRVPSDYIRMCEREKRKELEAHPNGEVTDDDIPF